MTSLFEVPQEFLFGLAGVVAAYVVIGAFLLALNVRSRFLWWIKAGAIVVTALFFGQSYVSAVGLTGWPSYERLPPHFQFHWAKINDPDPFTGDKGAIFLWLEPFDANNVPIGKPRAFRLRYSKELAEQLRQAQDKVKQGKEVAGKAEQVEDAEDQEEREINLDVDQMRRDQAGGELPENFVTDMLGLTFEEMPDIVMPEKTPY